MFLSVLDCFVVFGSARPNFMPSTCGNMDVALLADGGLQPKTAQSQTFVRFRAPRMARSSRGKERTRPARVRRQKGSAAFPWTGGTPVPVTYASRLARARRLCEAPALARDEAVRNAGARNHLLAPTSGISFTSPSSVSSVSLGPLSARSLRTAVFVASSGSPVGSHAWPSSLSAG